MTEKITYIPTRIRNAVKDGHVAGAEDIIDDVSGKTQDAINDDVATGLSRIEGKTDENRQEINRKQFEAGAIEFDTEPTQDSEKMVRSGAIYSFVKNEEFKQVYVPAGTTALELQPNKLYVFGEVEELTLGFAAGSGDAVKEYNFQFTCPADVNTVINFVPSSVHIDWSGNELDPEAGMTYQVSIVNNLGVFAEWEAAGI